MPDWMGDVEDNDTDEETADEPAEETTEETTESEGTGSALADELLAEADETSDETEEAEPSEEVEEEPETDDVDEGGEVDGEETEDDSDDATDEDVASAVAEAAEDSPDESSAGETTDDDEAVMDNAVAPSAGSQGSLISETMLQQNAPNAVARADAASRDPRWTVLAWGDEGTGKSHFAHTAPAPICYLDTEGKAHNLAEKFDKEVVYFDATDYDAARSALVQSIDLLSDVREQHDVIGTIVVDSMSKLWEFAQQKHVDEHYVTKESPEDVTFKSGLQGGDDWKKIKKYHNARFRDVLAESPFHVVMTAMAEEDYNAVMEGADGKPMKPQGEKNNKYAVENIVRLRSNNDGETVGDLLKTDRTRLRFRGLEWPEFDDVTNYIQRIKQAEQAEGSVDVEEWDVDIVRGSPANRTTEEDDE